MEHPANTTPETVIESVPNEPPVEPERKPLKPGKWYGIIALLCGANVCFFLLSIVLVNVFYVIGLLTDSTEPFMSLWNTNAPILFGCSPLCVIAGIAFGIWGRNTEGRYYAFIGLALSVLYVLTVSPFVVYNIFFSPPCC